MKRITVKIAAMLLIAMFTLVLAACGGSGNDPKPTDASARKDFDVNALAKDIFDNCSFEDEYLAPVEDKNFILTLNNIDPSLVAEENGTKLVANYVSSAYPEMIFVAKAVDENAAKQVCEAMKKVVNAYIENYTNYGPEQVAKLNNCVGRTIGQYVILAVTNDNTAAAAYIDSVTK